MKVYKLFTFVSYLYITSSMTEPSSSNVLGLNFDNLHLNDSAISQDLPQPQSDDPPPDLQSQDSAAKDKKTKPYVNPERVKTGGSQRVNFTQIAYNNFYSCAPRIN